MLWLWVLASDDLFGLLIFAMLIDILLPQLPVHWSLDGKN